MDPRPSSAGGQQILVIRAGTAYHRGAPRASSRAERSTFVQFHRARIVLFSAILTAASILATVATALAAGSAPPIPR
jgi:hypothetical protein